MSRADEPGGAKVVPLRPARDCPVCGRRASRDVYPFCSKRCSDVDLNRWISGGYSIPGEPIDPTADSEDA